MSGSQGSGLESSGHNLPGYEAPIGPSPALVEIRSAVARLAATDSHALIVGETGVGKDLIAQLIHRNSSRAEHPYVALNCAALPDGLVESELFGYERGAFTGADRLRAGHLEQANGGTLFLDEIGELKLEAQAKLLRALDNREIYRLGGRRIVPLDIRIIAATNRDLAKLVKTGGFRPDLYWRLNVGRIYVPPLRERCEDILPLAEHFLKEYCGRVGLPPPVISDEVRKALESYSWAGNVRELRNVIEVILMRRPEHLIDFAYLPDEFKHNLQSTAEERRRVVAALERTRWNKKRAAEELGWSRTTLYRKIKEYGIE
jgi:two-component system response regulator HydG/two-component system response regulator AtoC